MAFCSIVKKSGKSIQKISRTLGKLLDELSELEKNYHRKMDILDSFLREWDAAEFKRLKDWIHEFHKLDVGDRDAIDNYQKRLLSAAEEIKKILATPRDASVRNDAVDGCLRTARSSIQQYAAIIAEQLLILHEMPKKVIDFQLHRDQLLELVRKEAPVIGLEKDQLMHLRSFTQPYDVGYREKSDKVGRGVSDEFRNFLISHFELVEYLFELYHKEFPSQKIGNLEYYTKSILDALFKSGKVKRDNFRKWAVCVVPALKQIVFPEISCGPDKIKRFPDITLFLIEKGIVQLKPSEIGEYFKLIIPLARGRNGPEVIVSMGGLPAFTFNQLQRHKD